MQEIFRGTLLIYGPGSCSTSQLQPRGMGTVSTAGREVHKGPPNPAPSRATANEFITTKSVAMQSQPMHSVHNAGKPSHNPTETETSKGYGARFKFGSAEL